MPFCPQCGYEYQEGVRECPDCQQELVAEPPKEAHPTTAGWPGVQPPPPSPPPFLSNEPLVVVYEAQDPAQAVEIRQALINAGIPSFDQPDRTAAYDNLDFSMTGRYSRVLTLKSRAEEAHRVVVEYLRAFEDGKLELSEEEIEQIPLEPKPAPVIPVPHRGKLLLVLGILALLCMPPGTGIGIILTIRISSFIVFGSGVLLGIIVWIIAASDLADMRVGTRDPAGRKLTEAGKICGIVATFLPFGIGILYMIIDAIARMIQPV